MKDKVIDYFFTVATALFFLGIVISSGLFINDASTNVNSNIEYRINFVYMIPFIVAIVLSSIFVLIYIFNKNNYFKLIRTHIENKIFHYHYFGLSFLLLNFILMTIMIICCQFLKPGQIKFYFIGVIAVCSITNLIAIGLCSYSKFRIKVELAKKRIADKKENNQEINKEDNK